MMLTYNLNKEKYTQIIKRNRKNRRNLYEETVLCLSVGNESGEHSQFCLYREFLKKKKIRPLLKRSARDGLIQLQGLYSEGPEILIIPKSYFVRWKAFLALYLFSRH